MTILDLTYDGCCVEVRTELRPGDTIKLCVSGRGAIDAQVRWYDRGRAGLSFTLSPAARERELKPRVAKRFSVDVEVVQRRPGHPKYRVRLVDISRYGCKIEMVEQMRVGDHLWIKFERIEALHAEICWIEKFQAGVRYLNPLHPAVFELLIKQLST
ncbi:PilZ domain-containing protein [Sphingomonas sp. SE220]|uniref:PilZ domain-containing protein n=1 Tax=Sphingomonas hankyongi TaxID=2908209 RepID=A0ABT0S1U9_9SPHN|nr:PilZ domain-containing protein [Sphingomonas hankyongi]MCL6729796.1 PilZ domain-containing protein [Sphingomonas hankyongi]